MNRCIILGAMIACFLSVNLPRRCLATYVQWSGNGHWYEAVYVENGISWTGAKTAAETAGGYLATSTSAGENNFIFSLINDSKFWYWDGNNYEGPWLGGYQSSNNNGLSNNWVWVSGETWSYTNWETNAGAPNDRDNQENGEEDYLAFFTMGNQTLEGKWNDLPANGVNPQTGQKGYIIERDTSPGPSPVPEPATLTLILLSGIIGLVGIEKKKFFRKKS